jgi:hypothetical protein
MERFKEEDPIKNTKVNLELISNDGMNQKRVRTSQHLSKDIGKPPMHGMPVSSEFGDNFAYEIVSVQVYYKDGKKKKKVKKKKKQRSQMSGMLSPGESSRVHQTQGSLAQE